MPIIESSATLCLALGVAFTLVNWTCVFISWRQKRYVSAVFPFPSILTAIGLMYFESTRPFWWAAFLTDHTLMLIPVLVADLWRTGPLTRVLLLRSHEPTRRIELSLHRGSNFVLRMEFDPPPICDRYGARVQSLGMVGRWCHDSDGTLRLDRFGGERVLTLVMTGAEYICRESGYPQREFPVDRLDSVRFEQIGRRPDIAR